MTAQTSRSLKGDKRGLIRTTPESFHGQIEKDDALRTFPKSVTVRATGTSNVLQLDEFLGSFVPLIALSMIDFQTTLHSIDCRSLPVRWVQGSSS
jgi:hypothetical protein